MQTRINLKFSQRFQVCPELVDMIKVPLFFKSQLKIDATFDQNDEIRTLRLGFCSKIFLVKTFDRDWFDENQEKKSIDKIHSKSQTKPKISNLSSVSPRFFFLDSLDFSLVIKHFIHILVISMWVYFFKESMWIVLSK